MIPYGRQNITQDDIDAVVSILKSDFLTQGPAIEAFEKTVAAFTGAKYAVAVSNATAALHIACIAAGLKKGDSLWTSPNSFVASSNCGLYCGATVDFVDIDEKTYNMSAEKLEAKLILHTQNKIPFPKVVVPVHFAGQAVELEKFQALSKKYGFRIIEDASHGIGGKYKSHRLGDSAFSDMTVFSFHPVKIITTGEGGMILTNKEDLYQTLLRLRTHGITRNPKFLTGPHKSEIANSPWYYQQIDLGYNYRITDMQAALGMSQMARIEAFIQKRHEVAGIYNQAFKNLSVTIPWQNPDNRSAFHLYVLKVKNRADVFRKMRDQGIGVNVHYIPIHTQPFYQELGFKNGDFPIAEAYYNEAISLPMYYGLTNSDQIKVIEALKLSLQENDSSPNLGQTNPNVQSPSSLRNLK